MTASISTASIGPWTISYDRAPVPGFDWTYLHADYDGAESPAWMAGRCESREACIAEIIEGYEDRLS